MTLTVGDWVILPGGALAEVTAVGGEPPSAKASAVSGGTISRPLANAELRWTKVPEDGLRVRLALDPASLQAETANDPVIMVVAALRDGNGAATTAEIRDAAAAAFETPDELRRWWNRAQKRLDDDPRIDARDARQKRYRLLGEGERQINRIRPRRSGRLLNGFELLDAPRLQAQRDKAKRPSLLDESAIAELMSDANLDRDGTVDPTDRFLSGEIAIMLKRRDEGELGVRLGPSVLGIDLLRIRAGGSRSRAIRLARRHLEHHPEDQSTSYAVIPIVASAGARSDMSVNELSGLTNETGVSERTLWAWAIRWAAPGSDENADPAYPDDLVRYRERVRHVIDRRAVDDPSPDVTFLASCLDALELVAGTTSQGDEWERTMAALGEAFWSEAARHERSPLSNLFDARTLTPETWLALVDEAPPDHVASLRQPVERAYVARSGLLSVVKRLAERLRLDLGAVLIVLARELIRASRAPAIALDALANAADLRNRAESVSLAGTLASENGVVIKALEREAAAARDAALSGDASRQGPLLLTEIGWRGVVRDVYERVERSDHERQAAVEAAETAIARAEELETALERRRGALEEARSSRAEESATSSARLGLNLLRPVAAALSDSYESPSLGALQDRLKGVLARMRVTQLGEIGEVVEFDPDRHTWVSEGYPTREVRVAAPGWEGRDGDVVIVLAPARVVEHPG